MYMNIKFSCYNLYGFIVSCCDFHICMNYYVSRILLWKYGVNIFMRVYVDVFTGHMSLQYVFSQGNLNLWQRRWLKLLKDYDISVLYHLGKANVVADANSRLIVYG